ncbi:tetratricopeptide repeat protein [candidate division WOR-3 bacterium]|nr:tetratricopeptide repeat protein [candidate division WOR-3 bacterium]
MRHKLGILLIVIVSAIIYANTFRNEFVFDDINLIVENYEIRKLSNIFHFSLMKQPVREITFAIDYRLWKLNPFGYHLTNLILHILCSLLVYFFVASLPALERRGIIRLRRTRATGKGFKLQITNYQLPLITALLFAAHPIHTEAVTGIANRKELLAMLFMMFSIILYIKSRDRAHSYPQGEKKKSHFSLFYIGSLVCFLIALFSKFVAIIIPFLILVYELYFNKESRGQGDEESIRLRRKGIGRIFWLLPYFVILLVGIIYGSFHFKEIFWQAKAIGLTYEKYGILMLTMLNAFGKYLSLLVIPYNLCAEYVIQMPHSIFEPKVIGSLLLLIILLFTMLKTYRKAKFISFGLAWVFINLIPISNIIPTNYPVAERYMYIPSLGFCLILGWLICKCRDRVPDCRQASYPCPRTTVPHTIVCGIPTLILMTILIAYSILTIIRNNEWRNAYTLWSKTVIQSPNSAVVHNNLGTAYDGRGNPDKAIYEYKKAVEIDPNYKQAHYNLAASYADRGDYEEASYWHDKLIKIDPNCSRAYIKTGKVMVESGNFGQAIAEYKKAENIEPNNPGIKISMGYIYERTGKYQKAEVYYKKAIEIDPKNPIPYFNLGNVYREIGDFKEAILVFQEALKLNPSHAEAWYNLGVSYEQIKDYKNAIKSYKQFLKYWQGSSDHRKAVRRKIEGIKELF